MHRLVASLCAIWYVKTCVLGPMQWLGARRDFINYWHAGQAILSGRSPYADSSWFYPPVTAFLLAPFALTDYLTARWIWFVLSQAFMLAAAWLLWRAAGRDRIALLSVAAVWAFCGGASESIEGGQIGPLLALLLAAAYIWRSGVVIGTGFALKYLPGITAVPLIFNRAWRALVCFAVTGGLGVLIPWGVLMLFFPGPYAPSKPDYWMGTPHVWSWSIPSVVLRILDPPAHGGRVPYNWDYGNIVDKLRLSRAHELASVAAAAAVLISGLIVLAVVCRARLNGVQSTWAMAGLISLSLAASPVCWTHYQILQYPGIALLLADSIRRRAWGFTAAVAACAAFLYPLPYAILSAYFRKHGGYMADSPATLYVWTSVAPVACLILFGLFTRRVQSLCSPGSESSA